MALLFLLCLNAKAQYVYFNEALTSVEGASTQTVIFDMTDYYLTFGNSWLTVGFEYRMNDELGVSLENQTITTSPYYSVNAELANGTFLKTPAGFVASALTLDNSCSPQTWTAGSQLLNEQFEQIWVHQFPEWSICDSVTNYNIAYDLVDDTSFVVMSRFDHQNGQSFEPDSS